MQRLRWKIAQFLEVKWWQNYLAKKEKGQYYAWKKNYWTHFLTSHSIFVTEGKRILDAGCGPAGIFTILDRHEVVALDPLLDYYQKHLLVFDPSDWPWVAFIKTDLESFQSEKPFDLLFCLNAINHVADLNKSLGVLSSVSAPGGRLILSVDVHRWRFFRWLFGLLPLDILHPHQLTEAEYKDRIERVGFEVEEVKLIKKEFFFKYLLILANKSC